MFCIKCGAEIQEGTRFCIHCGTPVAGNPASESPEAESPKKENPESETPEVEIPESESPEPKIPEVEISEVESPETEIPEAESPRPEIPGEAPPRAESSEADSIVIKIPKIKIPKVDNPAISETGEKVKEMGKKYLKDGVEKAQKAYQYGSEQIKSGSITIPKAKLGKKKLSMIGGIVLLIVVILAVSSLFKGSGSGFNSPEKAFDAWMAGFCGHDFDLTIKAEPDFVIKYEGGEAGLRTTLQRSYENDIAPRVNESRSFRFEATGHTLLEKEEVENLAQRMEAAYGVKVKLSAAAVIHHNHIVIENGVKTEEPSSYSSGYAFKYKGKWYYLNIESA